MKLLFSFVLRCAAFPRSNYCHRFSRGGSIRFDNKLTLIDNQ